MKVSSKSLDRSRFYPTFTNASSPNWRTSPSQQRLKKSKTFLIFFGTIYLSAVIFEFWPQSWDIAKKQKLQQQQQKPLFSLYLRIGVEIRKSLRTGKLYLSKESIAILNWTIRSVIWAVRGGATGLDPSSSYISVLSVMYK